MSNLTLLGLQNYYCFELMGSQNYYRFIFCDDFLVIFNTPIFEQLFFVSIFWLFLIHRFLATFHLR